MLAMVLVLMGNLAELAYTLTGAHLKLLYFVGIPAVLAAVFSGAIPKAVASTPGRLYFLFVGFMVAAVPFSVWKAGALDQVRAYLIYVVPYFLIFAGVFGSWRQMRGVLAVFALSGVIVVGQSLVYKDTSYGRLSITSSGTIGNPNDLAAHLLILLPLVLWVALDKERNVLTRLVCAAALLAGLGLVLQTGSRGALVSLIAASMFYFATSRSGNQLKLVIAIAILSVFAVVLLPDSVLQRITDLKGESNSEVGESTRMRSHMFYESIWQTLRRPVFGVGPGQFATQESLTAAVEGRRGVWHAVHCSWTQISSECGVPALLMFLGAVGVSFAGLYRAFTKARALGLSDVSLAMQCLMLSFVGFFVAISFMPFAYRFQSMSLIGVAIPVCAAAQAMIRARLSTAP
jgi:hypothetical protein